MKSKRTLLAAAIGAAILTAGFRSAGQFNYGDEVKPYDSGGAAWVVWWAFFGSFNNYADYNWLVATVVWCYSFTAGIILVNLLIAMLTNTFENVQSQSERVCAMHTTDSLQRVYTCTCTCLTRSPAVAATGVCLQSVDYRPQIAPFLLWRSTGAQRAIHIVRVHHPVDEAHSHPMSNKLRL